MARDETESVRERKRKETLHRIADAGMRLFGQHGYEATTLDAIAAEAGISRRTFFHYFKSKDEILLAAQTGLGDRIVAALEENPQGTPLAALRMAMQKVVAPWQPEELLAIDRIMRASEAVQARKQANYALDEKVVLAAIRERWPDEPEMSLRLTAMLCIGLSRLSLDSWSRDGGTRPLAELLDEAFAALETICAER